MSADRFAAAVAAEVLAAAGARRDLLQSIADVARDIFVAGGTSVATLAPVGNDLVFEAVAGEGLADLVGARFPSGEGIAGAVAASGEASVIEDVSRDPRFAQHVAAEIGYMPRSLMAAPLKAGARVLGVIEVLDRGDDRPSADALRLLESVATQAGLAVDLGEAARRAAAVVAEQDDPELAAVLALARRLAALDAQRRGAAARLMAALEELLR